MRLEASLAESLYSGLVVWPIESDARVKHENMENCGEIGMEQVNLWDNTPGVLRSLPCGTWNCIVFGGLCPNSAVSSSFRSSSLSQMPGLYADVPLLVGVRSPATGLGLLALLNVREAW